MKNLIILLLLLIPTYSEAESTIQCHCFQDRSFNQHDVTAADSYFLATTQNSFLSLVYNIDKHYIVKAKMGGASGTHLWILFDVAKRSSNKIDLVKKFFSETHHWDDTLKKLKLVPSKINKEYQRLSNNPEQLADYIVDLQLKTFFGATTAEIDSWRLQGMKRKELILALLLGGNPTATYNRVTSGIQSWGELLFEQKLTDSKAISQKLKKRMQTQ